MKYLGIVLELLAEDEYYGISEEIEIAKGKNEFPFTWKKVFKKIKRQYKWQSKRLL